MSGGKNFQQIWDCRSKDDAIDSSTDDSESSGRGERKHKLVSVFFLEGNDESSDASGYEEIDRVKPGKSLQLRKSRTKKQLTTKVRGKKSMTERGSRKEVGRKKRKFSALSPASLDETEVKPMDLKFLPESVVLQSSVYGLLCCRSYLPCQIYINSPTRFRLPQLSFKS